MTPSRKTQKRNAKEKDRDPLSTRGIDHFGITYARFIKEIEDTYKKLASKNDPIFCCTIYLAEPGTQMLNLEEEVLASIKKSGFVENCYLEGPKFITQDPPEYIPPSKLDIESGMVNEKIERITQVAIDQCQDIGGETSPTAIIEVSTYNFQKFLSEQVIKKRDEGKIKILFDGKTLSIPGSQAEGYGPTKKRFRLLEKLIALSKKQPNDYVSTKELALIYDNNQVVVRDQIDDMNDLFKKGLGIEDNLIESKQNEGYRINTKHRIMLVNT